MVGSALGGLGLGAAAGSIGSALFGNKNPSPQHYPGAQPKSSKPIPIGTIAAGAGAAALGAAVLTGHHPVC